MIQFADCQDVRKMAVIKDVDCPKCGAKESIEVFERNGLTVGDSSCEECGYTISEGVILENHLNKETL